MIIVLGIGIIVIGGIFTVWFRTFFKSYNKQKELKAYMETDEYKEKMDKLNGILKKKDSKPPMNMYR